MALVEVLDTVQEAITSERGILAEINTLMLAKNDPEKQAAVFALIGTVIGLIIGIIKAVVVEQPAVSTKGLTEITDGKDQTSGLSK